MHSLDFFRPTKFAAFHPTRLVAAIAIGFIFPGCAALAQQPAAAALDPAALVRRASANELRKSPDGEAVRYRLRKIDEKGENVKLIVESRDGEIARLIELNNQPLNDEQQKAEQARLDNLLAHPEIQEKRHRRQQEDAGRGDEMVRLLPDAFLYQYIGMGTGPSGPVIKLSFKPNPKFEPPDTEGKVYHGMTGELWIDQRQERLTRIDAHLFEDVEFGWGILGRLYKGGSILVEQADVGNHHWEATHLKLNLTGKAVFFKTLSFKTEETSTDFQPVPRQMTFQEAIHLLRSPEVNAEVAQNASRH